MARMNCPNCNQPIPAELLKSEAARLMNQARITKAGGRPMSRKKRCPCGLMTAARAKARAHKCTSANLTSN